MASALRVSVVIPTRDRASLVTSAVASCLTQTLLDLEVVVVVDGPDQATENALAAIKDDRLRVIVRGESGGAPNARNLGVAHARGAYIAFLDDDDTWMSEKLARQLDAIERSGAAAPVSFTGIVATHSDGGKERWPRRGPEPTERVSDYLFVRRGAFAGEGMIITSTILTTRDLASAVPFDPSVRRYQDPDWLLRAEQQEGFALVYVPDGLVNYFIDEDRARISTTVDWRYALDWARERRELFSDQAYVSFLLIWLGADAARGHSWRGGVTLWREAARNGGWGWHVLAVGLGVWVVPPGLRRRLCRGWRRLQTLRG